MQLLPFFSPREVEDDEAAAHETICRKTRIQQPLTTWVATGRSLRPFISDYRAAVQTKDTRKSEIYKNAKDELPTSGLTVFGYVRIVHPQQRP